MRTLESTRTDWKGTSGTGRKDRGTERRGEESGGSVPPLTADPGYHRKQNYNEQAILEILYGCVEVIEIHNNGDMDVTMSKELMRSKFELYSIVESDYRLFYFSFTYKKKPSMTATGKPTTRKYWN